MLALLSEENCDFLQASGIKDEQRFSVVGEISL